MTKRKFRSIILALCSLAALSCSVERGADDGSGTVSVALSAETGFRTRAVDEQAYSNVSNYKVQVLGSSDEVECEYLYKDIPTSIRLKNGSYRLVASFGEDVPASRDVFYVVGAADFNVEGASQSLSVVCTPACGKVSARFDASMGEFFSDWSVAYETKALKVSGSQASWSKGDSEPWYLRLDEGGETVKAVISVTRKSDGKASTLERSYKLDRNRSWTLNIAPKNEDGSLGLSITVDESTNDKIVDIVVPADWI